MATATMEDRIRSLEIRLDELQHLMEQCLPPKHGYRAIVGTFADDPLYEEAMRLGREWRTSQHDVPKADVR